MSNVNQTSSTVEGKGNGNADVIVRAKTPLQEYESGLSDGQRAAIKESYALGTKAGRRGIQDALFCKAMKASDVKDARAALLSQSHRLIMSLA